MRSRAISSLLPPSLADIFFLKHKSSIFRSVIQPRMWFLHDGTGQTLYCVTHGELAWHFQNHMQGWMKYLNMLLSCLREKMPDQRTARFTFNGTCSVGRPPCTRVCEELNSDECMTIRSIKRGHCQFIVHYTVMLLQLGTAWSFLARARCPLAAPQILRYAPRGPRPPPSERWGFRIRRREEKVRRAAS